MPTASSRSVISLAVLLFGASELSAEEPLPANAVARIGTTRLRHGSHIDSVTFSPDGKKVISSDGWSVGVWDAGTGRELAFRMLREQYRCWPRVSPDGTLIA